MRAVAVLLLGLAACDPVDRITVRFAVHPGEVATDEATVQVFWVRMSGGQPYLDSAVTQQVVRDPELVVQSTQCCGVAASYRDGELGFFACIDRAGHAPVLVCGKVGDPEARLRRTVTTAASCDVIRRSAGSSTFDYQRCTVAVP